VGYSEVGPIYLACICGGRAGMAGGSRGGGGGGLAGGAASMLKAC